MTDNDFVTLTKLVNDYGLSGGGSNRFVTKNDLIDFGVFNPQYFYEYRAGEFVREKDIKYFQEFSITPNFLVDLNNTQNTTSSLFDEKNSLRLTPRSGTPNVTITTKDGFRCLKSNARGNQNVYQIAYSSVPTAIKNALISGSFTVVTFLALPSSEYNRWGVSCFYDKSQLTSGWMEADYRPYTNIMTTKWNTGHFAFDKKGVKTSIGMMAYAVDRSSKKIRHTNQTSATTYSPDLNISEIAFTGDATSGNGIALIGDSEYLQIGKSQESSYFMSTGCYFQALAIFTRALSITELQNIYKYKTLKSTYNDVEIYHGNFSNEAKQLTLDNDFDVSRNFQIGFIVGAKPVNAAGANISTLLYCTTSGNISSLELYFNHSTNRMYLDIYEVPGTKTTLSVDFDGTVIGITIMANYGTLEFSNTVESVSHKLYNSINQISKIYYLMNPRDSTRKCSFNNGLGGAYLQINNHISI